MDTFWDMLVRIALFVVLGVPGFILAKLGRLNGQGRGVLVDLLLYVAMPFLVFCNLLEADVRTLSPTDWIVCAIAPVVITALLVGLCFLIFRGRDARTKACRFCATFPNCGFLGIPLASSLFGEKSPVVIYVAIFNILSTFLLYVVGGALLSNGEDKKKWVKIFVSPLTIAVILGVICSCFSLGQKVEFLIPFAEIPAGSTTLLSMTVLGALLATLPKDAWWRDVRVWLTSLVKLVVSPLLSIGILLFLRHVCKLGIGWEVCCGILIATAVSTAASAPSMAEDHGGDGHYAATLTVCCTMLCLVTLPFVYLLFDVLFD